MARVVIPELMALRLGSLPSSTSRYADVEEKLGPFLRNRAHDTREPADALGDDRISLVRHRRGALLAACERLLNLAHLGAGQMANLGREALEGRGAEGEGGQELRVSVAWDDLRRGGLRDESETLAGDSLDVRVTARVRPDGAGELPDAHAFERPGNPLPVTVDLESPAGELRPEGDRLRMHAVRAADHDRVAVLLGSPHDDLQSALDSVKDELSGPPHLEREGSVEDV